MPRSSDKRERLIDAAKSLFHHRGYGRTSLADIAEASGVPLGNVYYYFKTKDDLALAVLAQRRNEFLGLLRECERTDDPRERLVCFLDGLMRGADVVVEHGCPVGSLCQELDKERSALSDQADLIVRVILDWVIAQFRHLGVPDAESRARHLLVTVQGASLMAHTLQDARFISEEGAHLRAWIEATQTPRKG